MTLYQDVTFGVTSSLIELIKTFNNLKKTQEAKEDGSPEWQKLEKAYSDHLLWRFEYPKQVYRQKVIATWLIISIVLVMVFCGIAFSYMQLQTAIKLQDFSSLKTDLAISTAGSLSLGSSIVGAVVLTLSLMFFFLYLKHVFAAQSLTPPHLGLLDTDAAKIYGKEEGQLTEDMEADLERIMEKYGYPGNSYHLYVKPGKHGSTVEKQKTE